MTEKISITFVLDGTIFSETTPRNASEENVRSLWTRLIQRPYEQFRFVIGTPKGRDLPKDALMSDLINPDDVGICIFVFRQWTVNVSVIRTLEATLSLAADTQTSLEQLIMQVSRKLDISEDRQVRLMVKDRLLNPELPVRNQFSPEDNLQVDLELSVHVLPWEAFNSHQVIGDEYCPVLHNCDFPKEICDLLKNNDDSLAPPVIAKAEEVRRVKCFASEAGRIHLARKKETQECADKSDSEDDSEECTIVADEHQRILTINKMEQIPLNTCIADLFADSILTTWRKFVILESRMLVLIDNRITKKQQTESLWPSTKFGDLAESNQCVMLDGKMIDPKLPLWIAGTYDNAPFTITEPVSLQVVDSKGRRHKLITDLHQPAVELHQEVLQFETTNHHFQVWFDGRCLSRETRTLAQLGLRNRSKVQIIFRTRSVEVTANNKRLTIFEDVKEGTPFHEFLAKVNEELETTLPEDTKFFCSCGRIFSNESQQRRMFPISCCETALLGLDMRVPVDQNFHGRWISCDFRLPLGGTSDVLHNVSLLANSGGGNEWRKLEEALLRSLLTIEEATAVWIKADECLDLLLQLSDEVSIPWCVRPTDSVYDAFSELKYFSGQPSGDVAVRGNRCVRARQRPTLTFEDLGVFQGQKLTLVSPTSDDEVRIEDNFDETQEEESLIPAGKIQAVEVHRIPHEEERSPVFTTGLLVQKSCAMQRHKISQILLSLIEDYLEQPLIFQSILVDAFTEAEAEVRHLLQECHHADVEGAVNEFLNSFRNCTAGRNKGKYPLRVAIRCGHADIVQLFINIGGNIDVRDDIYRTPLMIASEHGMTDIARRLIEAGCSFDAEDNSNADWEPSEDYYSAIARLPRVRTSGPRGTLRKINSKLTPLLIASERGHIDVARLLIAAGSELNDVNYDGYTPLSIAAKSGLADVVRLLIEARCNIEVKHRKNHRTPLTIASKNGHADVVRLLVEAGCSIESRDIVQRTGLTFAAERGYVDVVRLLLAAGCSIDAKDKWNETALMYAAAEGRSDTVRVLIDAGCFIDAQDYEKRTALMLASKKGHSDTVRVLIDAGCFIDAQDDEKRTALMLASKKGHSDIVQVLTEASCNIDVQDNTEKTALMYASEQDRTDSVRLLIEAGCRIDAQDAQQRTALMLATHMRNTDVVQLLVEAGCCIDSRNDKQKTALILASENGWTSIARLLIDAGCSLDAEDNLKRTALIYASEEGHVNIVRLLIEAKCKTKTKDKFKKTAADYVANEPDILELLKKAKK